MGKMADTGIFLQRVVYFRTIQLIYTAIRFRLRNNLQEARRSDRPSPSPPADGRHSGAGSPDGGRAVFIAGECDASISCSPACVGPSGPRRRNSPGWRNA